MGGVLGWAALLAVVGGGTFALLRGAGSLGILAAVAVGLGLRLATAAISHTVSLLNDNDGFLYLDDQSYLAHGETIAEGWASGTPQPFFEPVGILVHGGPLFYDLVGAVWFITDGHQTQVAMKLVNIVLAATMIVSAFVIARSIFGPRVARLAAWLVAVMPTLVWWSVPMMKEPLSGALFLGALAAATRLPRPSAVAVTTVLMAALALSRVTLALAAGAGLVAWLGLRTVREWRTQAARLAPATLAACVGLGLIAVMIVGGGSGEGIESQASQTVSQGQEAAKTPVRDGKAVRTPKPQPAAPDSVKPEEEPSELSGIEDDSFDSPVGSELAKAPITEAFASGTRFLISPRAWAFHTQPFDWHQPLYPAMWLWYLLFPAGLIGLWRARRQPDLLLLLVPALGTLALYAATLSSGVRQRSAVEPLLLILIAAGIATQGWRWTARAGALVLVVVAVGAAVDLAQPLAALPILAAAGLLWALSPRLPDERASVTSGSSRRPLRAGDAA